MIAHAKENRSCNITVPKAACLTTFAYNEHVKNLKLEQELADILLTGMETAELGSRLAKVRETIITSKISANLQLPINDFLRPFPKNVRFAVRSSSTAEDAGTASFAGQYDTVLNVPP